MAWNEPGGEKRNPWNRPQQSQNDLDDVLRNFQRRLSALFGRGGGSVSLAVWILFVIHPFVCSPLRIGEGRLPLPNPSPPAERGEAVELGLLDIEVQRKLQRMRTHAQWSDLFVPLVVDPTLNQLRTEDVAFEKEVVICL